MARQDIIVKLRLAGEQFDRDFKVKFQDLTEAAERSSLEAGARSGGGFVKGFLGTAGLAALGTAIGAAISSAADLGTEILSTSRQFNIGAEQLQAWRQAASTAGLSADDLNETLAELTLKIGEATAGNRQAQQSFVDLGIGFETTSGEARATDAVMMDLVKRIAEIQDPAERARLGTQLLGDEFKNIQPLLLQGADGFNAAAAEVGKFGGALTQQELQDLDRLNKDIEEMKNQLSRSVAKVVADNADSISSFGNTLTQFAADAVKATGDLIAFYRSLEAASRFDPRKTGKGYQQDYRTPEGDAAIRRLLDPGVAAPRVSPQPARGGGGGGRARTPTQSAADREAERAAKEAIRNEEQLRDAIARTLRSQEDSAEVQRIRAAQGEEAAARAEAELGFLRQHPLAVNETVEALAKALGITKALTQADRDRLQLLIDQGNAAQQAVGEAAARKARDELDRAAAEQAEEAERIAEMQAEAYRRLHEQAILDVADFYEIAFRGGTKDLWRSFKDEGTRIIAEIAAQWTLAMLSGQGFNLNSAIGGALGRSPLASIFGGAANDNGLFGGPTMTGFGGGIFGIGGGRLPDYITGSPLVRGGGGLSGAALRTAFPQAGQTPFLQSSGFALGLGTLAGSLVGGGGMAGQLGGLAGSIGGQALGSSIAALGSFGGPVGAIVGGILGSVLPKLLSSPKRASVTIGNRGGTLGITGRQGNSSSREQTATQGAGSLIDAIFQIADQLGGGVDASRGSVSFGMRKNSFRVDPTGRGITKVGNGAIDFGSDQEAAMRFAIQDLIKDGVITGISQASQNLLQRGGDLDKQIEKALLIEQIPKLLRQRTDPLGAALDELYDKFKAVNDALVEGSASAEQFAQARQLWELEKADAIASIGEASQSLKDFLASLNAGSSSPLSLREQRAEAERQLEPFLAQISAAESARAEVERLRASGASAAEIERAEAAARSAAAAINQEGFTQASELLLSISRQTNASSGAFFSDFDRIRALTGQAIGFVDQAAQRPGDSRDPFSQAIARNTQDAAYILSDQTAILNQILAAINDNGIGGAGGGGGFIGAPRAYVSLSPV